ncbi:hypothetical protein [Nostoc sp. 'Peltigera membranacea cyanobiont' 232]|uniref:hypothetical protein n=1 Tax=Nostoc sp. 'Peltigera membranacea cyanobiont' 232 TaxID=2014531 RepID=UPI00167523E9|nr:hypothetical protein [Nostoc sp. 'Peltigera membranacea cyanobiont' 232]
MPLLYLDNILWVERYSYCDTDSDREQRLVESVIAHRRHRLHIKIITSKPDLELLVFI